MGITGTTGKLGEQMTSKSLPSWLRGTLNKHEREGIQAAVARVVLDAARPESLRYQCQGTVQRSG